MTWTPPKLVKWISNDFKEKGFPPPHRFQAEMLVSHALKISRLDIYLQHDKPCTSDEQQKLRELVKRRYRREPLAYIIGSCDFWSLTLQIGPGVLIPRPETEILVEAVLEKIPKEIGPPGVSILELGTGSAAIPLALCSERSNLSIVGTEISTKALDFAKRNVDNHRHLITPKENELLLVHTDRFSSIQSTPIFDFIVSNPPYIPENQLQSLQKEVSDWEPGMALNGGFTGIDFYEYLKNTASFHLKPGGLLFFEHGYDQSESIQRLFDQYKALNLLEKCKDFSGHNRVLIFEKPVA